MSERCYITTPIYYVNDRPHIGHTYTTVLADVMARHRRMMGEEVYFLTGTDEHGQKIEKAAAARGITPKALADEVVPNFENLWKRMELTNDHFVRTTHAQHKATVQAKFQQLLASGDIFKDTYVGLYSVSDEAYVTETQAKELQAQGLAHQLVELREESYFFRLSAYENWLIQLYEKHPEFVRPEFRLNEVKQFVAPGGARGHLEDLSISRTSITWGIPVPGDEKHVVYVWFDALLNYLSACREGFWPPTFQLVGKDILRFHAIYWPAFLMAMYRQEGDDLQGELPARIRAMLPRTILAHGWWLMGEDKMSKSKGNVVRPDELLTFGVDAVRFFFMREMTVGLDRSFSFEGFMDRLNADLANGLGNLASRTLSMLQRYRNGVVPEPAVLDDQDREALEAGRLAAAAYLEKAEANDFHGALEGLWAYLRQLDGYIVKAEPWKLAKDDANKDKLDAVLCTLYRALRATAVLVAPVMPAMAQTLWTCLGQAGSVASQRFPDFAYDAPAPGPALAPEPLFQRIDKETVMTELAGSDPAPAAPVVEAPLEVPALKDVVDYDTFALTDLRVGLVLTAEAVPKSKKLIKMTVDLGFEKRTILGGIAAAYSPEDLVGRKVVVVANLAPRALMGIESHGMLLAASDNNSKPYLVAPPDDARPGYVVR
ncbi:methionine--tRNA ligase [Mesoterricola silvestris]|uniref:Methionine--tRNA ligase n=1 Tax=Mesoterricola silvestris TaxID=2927979 RepID=A0AA48GMN9_9BACT|nr:methionine--tRNA ligase [Mesoterricola silvestris]BDU72674.1 methionine--tRNA ligase [Mesoterricola silvestris]